MDDSKDCCEPSNICEGDSRPEYPNTELYVGTKIVKGVPMTETDFYKNIKKQDMVCPLPLSISLGHYQSKKKKQTMSFYSAILVLRFRDET